MIRLLRATSKLQYWNSKLVVKAEKLNILGENGIHKRVTSFSIELWPWNTTKTWLLCSQSIHNVNKNTEMYYVCILFIGRADTFFAIYPFSCMYVLTNKTVHIFCGGFFYQTQFHYNPQLRKVCQQNFQKRFPWNR